MAGGTLDNHSSALWYAVMSLRLSLLLDRLEHGIELLLGTDVVVLAASVDDHLPLDLGNAKLGWGEQFDLHQGKESVDMGGFI